MNDRTPFTYLIGWSKYNKWYYGCRIGKNCHPSDLWKTYFTSSKYVKQFRKEYGEPDIIEIRKIFDCKEKCVAWEKKVLVSMNVVKEEKWLNKRDYKFHPVESLSYEHKEKIRKNNFFNNGGIVSEETREKLRNLNLGEKNYWYGKVGHRKGKKTSLETRKKMSESSKGQIPWNKGLLTKLETKGKISKAIKKKYNEGFVVWNKGKKNIYSKELLEQVSIKRKNKMWVTNGIKSFTINKNDELPLGFRKGRILNVHKGKI